MLFLDVCLEKENILFKKEIVIDNYDDDREKTLNAIYELY